MQGERNFHVLYELVAGSAGTDLGDKLKVIHMFIEGEARGVAPPHPIELADNLYQRNPGVSLLGGPLAFVTGVLYNPMYSTILALHCPSAPSLRPGHPPRQSHIVK